MKSIKDSIADVGPGPCEGCANFTRCRDEELACTVYTCWMHDTDLKRKARATRKPSHAIYQRVFG
jgi:hypothetical protein